MNQRNLMKFVAVSKLNEESRSSSLALKKEQRKMSSSLKLSSAVTCKRRLIASSRVLDSKSVESS